MKIINGLTTISESVKIESKDIKSLQTNLGLSDFSKHQETKKYRYQEYLSIKRYLNSQRQGTHSTKTRADVIGSKKKPWRQKGTGRARHGDKRSPIWRGGGVVFGPKPNRNYSVKQSRNAYSMAFARTLYTKLFIDKNWLVTDFNGQAKIDNSQQNLGKENKKSQQQFKTKDINIFFKNLKLQNQKILICDYEMNENVYLACRNLSYVQYLVFNDLNVYTLSNSTWLVMTKKLYDFLLLTAKKDEKESGRDINENL